MSLGLVFGFLFFFLRSVTNRHLVYTAHASIGTLRYEDVKARTGTAVDAGNFRGSRFAVKNKMLKMRIFSKDGDVSNSNFVKAIPFTETVTSFRL